MFYQSFILDFFYDDRMIYLFQEIIPDIFALEELYLVLFVEVYYFVGFAWNCNWSSIDECPH